MKSSSGRHFIALDHIRALAAFLVFTWHFIHARKGHPVPFEYVPTFFPMSILDEGHTGVALFMTLSGYLFAKLLDGQVLDYGPFIRNRLLRLMPLMVVVICVDGVLRLMQGKDLTTYALAMAQGIVAPTWPSGGWSITIELHFYLLLPFLLAVLNRSTLHGFGLVAAAIALRSLIYLGKGEVQSLAFWTIVGRIDQFALGMIGYRLRTHFTHRHRAVVTIFLIFGGIYFYFDRSGGFYNLISYPSSSPFWIVLPTIEGLSFAACIAWYDNSFHHSTGRISRFIGRVGEYSYSIYLLHFFLVYRIAAFVNERIMDMSNFYVACLWSLVCFVLMVVPGYISFHLIEAPFLKLRAPYLKPQGASPLDRAVTQAESKGPP